MRPRTFILLILILLVGAIGVAVVVLNQMGGGGLLANTSTPPQGESDTAQIPTGQQQQEPGEPSPAATPATRFVPVVVARVPLPAGQRLTADILTTELRPDTNIALQAGYTFDSIDQVVGRIVKADIAIGKEILSSVLALNPSDLASFGSNLALYVDRGNVAVAFPIDPYTGIAYAMRPGDQIDVMMSLSLLELDEEFQTPLPNNLARIDRVALEEGNSFLFEAEAEGRLELLPLINLVAQIAPKDGLEALQIPRRVTQLTLQQVQVVWVGNWGDPTNDLAQAFNADAILTNGNVVQQEGAPPPEPTKERPEDRPDIVILSLTLQDALTLKWAMENGIDIHLALRAQGDNSTFVTTSVTLPQMVEQGPLTIPVPGTFSLSPPVHLVPTPGLPDIPVEEEVQP